MEDKPHNLRVVYFLPAAVMLLFAAMSVMGITWGLPSLRFDEHLFGGGPAWAGEKIYRLAGGGAWTSPDRGADVDFDPLDPSSTAPIELTATDEGVAAIYLRYRLYTYQPDEMIVMRSLGGMRPGQWDFDPKLYQYGGLFLYPVGALIRLAGAFGLIDVRSDVVYYLDNPDEFGKFYIVSRAYTAAWGLVGVLVVFAIGRRLSDVWGGLLAALLFTLMPVVVCMAHEGKPHLPGAVLMLAAVLFAMRHLAGTTARRDWWLMCVSCGAALGMVLSSLPIFVLIPLVSLVEWLRGAHGNTENDGSYEAASEPMRITPYSAVITATAGVALASLVYLIVNPYLVINALINREVLASNFGNSLAMYEMARVGEGFVRVVELTVEGATLPITLLGAVAFVMAVRSSMREGILARDPAPSHASAPNSAPAGRAQHNYANSVPLLVPALVIFIQFVLIGAGKPAEYGRFGVFVNTALAIGSACLLVKLGCNLRILSAMVIGLIAVWTAGGGRMYLLNFRFDAHDNHTRVNLARQFLQPGHVDGPAERRPLDVALLADPAPYGCPPMNFASTRVFKLRSCQDLSDAGLPYDTILLAPVDLPVRHGADTRDELRAPSGFIRLGVTMPGAPITPISWANKPFDVIKRDTTPLDADPTPSGN